MPRMTLMRWVRRAGAREDAGAVAVLVVVLLAGGVLLGMAALTIDVGSLYGERRQLQNSADAGALSLAQDCVAQAAACTTTGASITGLVNSNDTSDGTSAVAGVCIRTGGVSTGLCGGGGGLADCPAPPAGMDNYVEVRTSTRTSSGGTLLPPVFAQAIVNGYSGTRVGACTRVAWGGPRGLSSAVPLTISNCEFQHYVGNPPNFAPPPPYPPTPGATWPAASYEHVIFFHDTTEALAGSCPTGQAGSDDPISGGFGWLESTNCVASSDIVNWFDASPGTSPGSDCRAAEFASSYGQLVDIPIYDGTNGLNGANGKYHMRGYAAFVLTGYYLGGSYKKPSLMTGQLPCGQTPTTGSQRCISGFFTHDLTPTSGVIGGAFLGVPVIQMIG
ncbi:MAG TPA: pilus assembly protein TadG-related protein [Actinomycetales bacterium]|nr:pilus assembly protein TadG-related protein [Actinomycetales bacterium]